MTEAKDSSICKSLIFNELFSRRLQTAVAHFHRHRPTPV